MRLGARDVHRTGRSRFRLGRWSKRPVFQIEWAGRVTRLLGPHPDTEFETWWRDATVEDLTSSKWEVVDD